MGNLSADAWISALFDQLSDARQMSCRGGQNQWSVVILISGVDIDSAAVEQVPQPDQVASASSRVELNVSQRLFL